MAKQLHKRFSTEEVKMFLQQYLDNRKKLPYLLEILQITKRRFFHLLQEYKENPDGFSIDYQRKKPTKKISNEVEKNIIEELKIAKSLIENKELPITYYNYSYIKDQLYKKHKQKVSVPTIIKRAKDKGFYKRKKRKKKSHDREVQTEYIGQLIQHDASYHKFSPYANKKWYLITSLDDYSRFILFYKLVERETVWQHIRALENVILTQGVPFCYYVDSHSIFRFVQGRDSMWRRHYLQTDDVDTQWKKVATECNIKVEYALSPQARGKIERPYQWMQDRVVRTCAREKVRTVEQTQRVLEEEMERYNYHQVHSTTGEIPNIRFQRAKREEKSLFRDFVLPSPYKSTKDIFCLRVKRTVDAYHKISISNLKLRVHKAPLRKQVELRIVPDEKKGIAEVRIWYKDILCDVYHIKSSDLNIVKF